MRTLPLAVLAVTLLVTGGIARAQTAAVLPPSGVNVAPETLEAAQDVFRAHLAHTGKLAVITVPGAGGKIELDAQAAVGQARAAGADIAVVLHLVRLGSKAQVRLSAYATSSSALIYSDRMAAASPDDLDRVLERLAKGMATFRPSAETAELDTVTQTEATAPLKRAATHVFGVGLGVIAPMSGDPIPGLDIFWLYDARSFFADVSLGLHAAESRSDVSFGLGAYYPFGAGDLTPYLGGGARWASTSYGGDQGSGIQLYAALGVLTGRLGSVQLRGQLEYFVNTFRSTGWIYDDSYSASDTAPVIHSSVGQGIAISIGLGF